MEFRRKLGASTIARLAITPTGSVRLCRGESFRSFTARNLRNKSLKPLSTTHRALKGGGKTSMINRQLPTVLTIDQDEEGKSSYKKFPYISVQ
ncbi:unnamed protein product [Litomosoides sigmodontis]|uniref:Uncharacterized protein n=1 Tax=Litomosoides sigmodontis TaxID=42156 RepID=A0A3P6SF49_LITSI|nr:unnamed protein product [Litomosoides sigmodontis]